MTKRIKFGERVKQLLFLIRQRQKVSRAEACLTLDVGPWQIDRYAAVILRTCEDVRWNAEEEAFETIIRSPPKLEVDLSQKSVDDYVQRVQGAKDSKV